MASVYELNEQACKFYVDRAQGHSQTPEALEHFKSIIKAFPVNSECEHALVWPVFIGALASTTAQDQSFFSEALRRHYRRTGFANILRAIEYLEISWARGTDHDWTTGLSDSPAFIV